MIFTVKVGVALSRQPRTHEYRMYRIIENDGHTAELTAQQWAQVESEG